MGAQQSIAPNIDDYKSSDRLGIYRQISQNGTNFIQVTRQLPNQRMFQEWAAKVQDIRRHSDFNQVIFLPAKYYYNKSGFCGSAGTLKILFHRWENFLKEEVSNRRRHQAYYTEQELWYITFYLAKLGPIYQPLKCKLGDLHPNNVVVTPEGFIRVITRHSLPNQLTNFQKVVEEINSDVYLAPQEMDQKMIENGVYEINQPTKSDAFSFGITVLEAATLQNCSYLYIRNPLRISIEKLNYYTKILKEKYSPLFYNTIMSTLLFDPKKRVSISQIYHLLQPYEEFIQKLERFKLTQSPGKEVMNDSRAFSIMAGQESVNNSRANFKQKQNGPFSPPTQQNFSFVKKS